MKILFVSLGCDKNLVDSEVMLGLLTEKGYTITNDEQEADIIVINTCCFIHDAKEESIMTILEMAALKEQNLKALIVTGCLAERYKEEILEEIPEIDAVLGTTSYTSILEAVDQALAGKKYTHYEPVDYLPDNRNVQRMVTTGNYMAYMKIGEGCDKRCTYCVIPKIRGSYRSVPMEELLAEARRLAQNGVKELVLVAQETTVYGVDLYGKKTLPKLLKELCKIDGIEWIRLLYCYPEEITEELIQTIKEEKKICHYIDMPIQHCDDKILQRMGRRTNQAQLREVIRKFREEIPDMVIRTSLITGFPGESSEQHENLLNFVDEMEFERLGVFTYSQEEDTIAAGFEDQIPEEIKEQRRDEIMALQQEISYEQDETLVGTEMKVLIEGYLYEDDIYVGRTYRDAPKVDGCIFVHAEEEIISGDFVNVRVTAAREYDLIGDVIYE
ncbi:MAG: 30S ribosomal protein S12 methylthiotransferase RimO [Anaerostipes sp.]|uniref:30S ribosomal protein S12 methylthiotransferase RimO n=1 Tax=Anaerostipes sp. 992a TaxID=1261637 RepID=UPI00095195B9|nr:30S ribosomal protein S12 methylthiotransferase RimO [Anaerostipes sp. 992a]MCI5951457.1 30S ribosomal protein S12 methylthiotransferase RimO [Anaerostipes sp.]MDD5968742.1 30S ribosomal protein S12 methylthiotransferase RimO [Anaerostipes sp.]OLR62377.1 ribosomal protein S12 methylthiotransferase RimO [Anaerostipes sp. 992a]